MAIHAKKNGLLIGGKLVGEGENHWIFQAMDNKGPTVVRKDDPKSRVFDCDNAVYQAMKWQAGTVDIESKG
ncbi:hypothetical protein [Erwinia phage Snitter]|nr:hypothetical protein [Erwinia phage Snitter]